MTNYLLDTNICVFLLRNERSIEKKLENIKTENCFISEITQLELLFGAECSANPKQHRKTVTEFFTQINILPIADSFGVFALEKARLKKEGFLISDFDLLIGATAIANKLIMVTDNQKPFARLQNIKLENWVSRKA